MLNKLERKIIGDIYCCLGTIRGLYPSNNCNIAGLSEGLHKATEAAAHLHYAIEDLLANEPEYEIIEDDLQDAADILEIKLYSKRNSKEPS